MVVGYTTDSNYFQVLIVDNQGEIKAWTVGTILLEEYSNSGTMVIEVGSKKTLNRLYFGSRKFSFPQSSLSHRSMSAWNRKVVVVVRGTDLTFTWEFTDLHFLNNIAPMNDKQKKAQAKRERKAAKKAA